MGSGKSYFGTELAYECLKQGGYVHTNLPLKMEVWQERGWADRIIKLPGDPRKMVREDPEDLDENGKPKLKSDYLVMGHEGAENIIVLDEASLEFDVDAQMDKGDKERNKPIFKLVALCRHAGLDMYFLAQSSDNVHAKLRRMAEQRIKCAKTERLPVVGWLLAMLPFFGAFLRIYYQGTDKTAVAKTWHKWRPEIGDSYDTHGMRVGLDFKKPGETGERKKATETTQAKGKAFALGIACLLVFLVGFAWLKGSSAYADIRQDTATKKPLAATKQVAPATGEPASPALPVTRRSMEWAEWDLADEWPINCILSLGGPVRVHTDGGVLSLGGSYQGESITGYVKHGDYHYFKTARGRYVVARPYTEAEKQARRIPKKSETVTEKLFGESL